MKKIIVGISSGLILDESGRFDDYWKVAVNEDYVTAVIKAGGIPLVIPTVDNPEIIKEHLKLVDAVIISGGNDINPVEYNEEHLAKNGRPQLKRDIFDKNLIKIATEMKLPTLGICRGMQFLNVAFGGSLYQDLSYKGGVTLKHDQYNHSDLGTHKISITKGSLLGNILGKEEAWINSFHHQGVKQVAEPLVATSYSTDEVVESVELKNPTHFFLGVQWHPEMMASKNNTEMLKIFEALIASAKK